MGRLLPEFFFAKKISGCYIGTKRMVKNKKTSKKLELDEKNIDITDKIMDPKIDVAFKELFGHNQNIFMNFVNAILGLKEDKKIVEVQFLNSELSNEKEEERGVRLDVFAKFNDNTFTNLEMQYAVYKEFEKRTLYHFSKIYRSQLKKGENIKDLKPVIMINILNFELFDDVDDFHSKIVPYDILHQKRRCNDLEVHFIEIPKLHRNCYNVTDNLERWVLFLKEPTKENLEMLAHNSQEIAEAYEKLENLSKNPKKRIEYEARKMQLLDDMTQYASYRDEGEIKAKLEMAREMKSDGEPLEKIMKYTHLTKEQIDAL
jgi:predicted transposase/invertase (TIGR01784 family)